MFRRRTSLCIVMALVAMLIAPAAVRAQGDDNKLSPKESGRVILNWETFRELTKPAAKVDPEKDPKLTLPWSEVQDILGVKIKDPKLKGAELTLNWQQFRALLEWSVARKKPVEKPIKLPADFIIASSDVTGTLHEKDATLVLKMSLDILKEEGWKRIPLLPATVALEGRKMSYFRFPDFVDRIRPPARKDPITFGMIGQ